MSSAFNCGRSEYRLPDLPASKAKRQEDMQSYLITFLALAFVWRIFTVVISSRHEAALRSSGAREYCRGTSVFLAVSHVSFYLAVVAEGSMVDKINRTTSILGICLYAFSALTLLWVMRSLGSLWTIKLIIAPEHRLVRSGLFRFVRHPNYFLSIIPELAGLALAAEAYRTLLIGLALYTIPLTLRIRQEERLMREAFSDY
jgi:isoprenylcysteine carboxyl methyltransferase (ICMT) family protein YpbQ